MATPRGKVSIAILGSGPSAAYAYRACRDLKVSKIEVYTDKLGKPPAGAFYLHWLPPSIAETTESIEILYTRSGNASGYTSKMWGDSKMESSFPTRPWIDTGFEPAAVWEQLWKGANIHIVGSGFSDADVADIAKQYYMVIQTFPTMKARREMRNFTVVYPTVVYGAANLGPKIQEIVQGADNFILYNGHLDVPWVRLSQLFGKVSMEYPMGYDLGNQQAFVTPDLLPDTPPWIEAPAGNVMLAGRWATFNRKELAHETYYNVQEELSKVLS